MVVGDPVQSTGICGAGGGPLGCGIRSGGQLPILHPSPPSSSPFISTRASHTQIPGLVELQAAQGRRWAGGQAASLALPLLASLARSFHPLLFPWGSFLSCAQPDRQSSSPPWHFSALQGEGRGWRVAQFPHAPQAPWGPSHAALQLGWAPQAKGTAAAAAAATWYHTLAQEMKRKGKQWQKRLGNAEGSQARASTTR